jgi:iron complex outermembrane recepter protein
MSELSNTHRNRFELRGLLLATSSAVVLSTCLYASSEASAADSDRPVVWIELGGEFEQISTSQDSFVPPFTTRPPTILAITPGDPQIAPGSVQKPLDSSFGFEGKISIEPEDSDWMFSAGVIYGRSNGAKHIHHQTTPKSFAFGTGSAPKYIPIAGTYGKFADAVASKHESHAILDFQAGKDLGLGIFGQHGQAIINVGLRFAQFHNDTQVALNSGPDPIGYKYYGTRKLLPLVRPFTYRGKLQASRSFMGLGPSVSWDASSLVIGNASNAAFTLDWGAHAAVLFGRQKANIQHQTSEYYQPPPSKGNVNHPVYQTGTKHPRSRSIVVPNVGGMAGLSLKFPNAKVSLGYRADFFFGAMDGGIDTAKKENVGFYGPFATVSVGIGG